MRNIGSENRGKEAQAISLCYPSAGARMILFVLRAYQAFLSPHLGGACKFQPSCSDYAAQAIARFGARGGLLLAAKRLLRCRPFSAGGWDPVPEVDSENKGAQARRGQVPELRGAR